MSAPVSSCEGLELVERAERDADVELVRELGADAARRLARRAGREHVPLEQDDVAEAEPAQVERGARAHDAAADDDRVRPDGNLGHTLSSRTCTAGSAASSDSSSTSKTAFGVPAAHQTRSNRRSEASANVGSSRSWPSGGTPPIAKPVASRASSALAGRAPSPSAAVSTRRSPAQSTIAGAPSTTKTSDLTIWPSSQLHAAAASRAVRVESGSSLTSIVEAPLVQPGLDLRRGRVQAHPADYRRPAHGPRTRRNKLPRSCLRSTSRLRSAGRRGHRRRSSPRRRVFLLAGSLVSGQFAQQTVSGLASGGIYASLALAIVLIYRATQVINFAQGGMAMFTTYVAWELMQQGYGRWSAYLLAILIAFAGGVLLERTVIRPVENAPAVTTVIVTIGLLVIFNGLAGWIWSAQIRPFRGPFPTRPIHVGGVAFSLEDLGTIAVALAAVTVLWAFFRFTRFGLALRAAASQPAAARLVGIRVGWMLALGWGLAAALGAVSGILVAPVVFLQPNMMDAILIYAFAAAVLGGIDSPLGAVVGGLTLGVLLNLLGTYVHAATAELRLPIALALLLVVLLVKPSGLFGRAAVRKV